MTYPSIQLLPPSLANKIAAGEVVQRPASVLKELLENAIDAGATSIKILLRDGGKELIRVLDNGRGMDSKDAHMSLLRHATSKIVNTEDLFAIQSFGFRGEALAAISAVSHLTMRTQRSPEKIGISLQVEGGKILSEEPIQMNKGTDIAVKHLFFNTPARRKFLRTSVLEQKHLLETFQRIALAYPALIFHYIYNDKEIYQLPATQLHHRIIHLMGKNYQKQLLKCKEQTDLLEIRGYIGTPEQAKKTRGGQFFFVNNRYIRSSYLEQAVRQAFEGLVPSGAYPFFVLHIDIAPEQIDINIHPSKLEVKFEEERTVYAILRSAVKKALASHHMMPSIDFTENVNQPLLRNPTIGSSPTNTSLTEKHYSQFRPFLSPASKNATDLNQALVDFPSAVHTELPGLSLTSSDKKERPTLSTDRGFFLKQHYWIGPVKSGILLIHLPRAYERIVYQQYAKILNRQQPAAAQQLLFCPTITLLPNQELLLQEAAPLLAHLGFKLLFEEKQKVTLEAVPVALGSEDPKGLIDEILAQYHLFETIDTARYQERWLRVLAKKIAVQYCRKGVYKDTQQLIEQLFICENPNFDPSGKKIWRIIEEKNIEQLF